jgi:hypothetical protein
MNSYCSLLVDRYFDITRWFIPSALRDNARDFRNAQNAVTLALLAVTSVPLFASLYHFLEFDKAGMIVLAGGAAMLCAPLVLKFTGRLVWAREVFICSFFGMKLLLAYYLGGIGSPTLPWLLLCPMIAMVLGGVRAGAIWGIVITITVSGLFYLQTSVMPFPPVPVSDQRLLQVVSVLGLFIFSAILLLFFRPGASQSFAFREKSERI